MTSISIDDKLIRSLLVPDSTAGQILFVQEGVALKASTSHDGQTYLGTLFVTSDSSGAIFILWLPYSFVYYIDPALVSPATKQSLALGGEGGGGALSPPTTEGKPLLTADGHIPLSVMRAEWLYSQCMPFESVNRIRCKATMRGKRVITLHRSGTISEQQQAAVPVAYPLTFHDGGVDRLLAVLGSFATVQSAPGGSHDDYTVQHQLRSYRAPVHAMSPEAAGDRSTSNLAIGGDAALQQFRDQAYNNNSNNNSNSAGKKVGQRLLNNLVGLVSRGGKFLAEAFLDDDEDHVLTQAQSNDMTPKSSLPNANRTTSASGEYDMMQPIQSIEDVKPKLKFPSNLPARGAPLTRAQWQDCFDDESRGGALNARKFAKIRNIVFEGGIAEEENQTAGNVANQVRAEVWKYLLGVYPIDATAAARQAIDEENVALYESVLRQWTSIGAEQEKHFTAFRERRTAVDKDVARTDRTHSAFSEDHSEKLLSMRKLLLTYSFFNFDIGYCQGMSDIISVLLLLYETDAEIFAVFRCLMNKCGGNFMNGEQHTMASQLRAIEVLTHAFVPPLYSHLQKQQATNMCFCFRWLLVLFKREFPVESVVKIWDVIFACPFSDRYEIIMATSLLRAASDQIIDHSMAFDELLKYSNQLCSGLSSVEELLRASAEFYNFCVQQYEWTNASNNNQQQPQQTKSKSGSSLISDQEKLKRKQTHGGEKAEDEMRPSIRDLVEAFEMK